MRRAVVIVGLAAAVAVALVGMERSRAVEGGVFPHVESSAADAPPRMLELYTPWCPSCVKMKPVVEDLAARCAGKGVRIEAVDVSRDENERIAEQYGVSAVPTFLFLDENGVETERLVGAQSEERIERAISKAGFGPCGTEV